ncbi:MAG TPA: cyclic nucleotide-binding domain-containing protein [Burkholderiaceae bacterium]|nr:cyclic nucleotide-binding domain-containing protein [Burkholderiaceae bacterium]HMZ00227.1 cyclic nucleotide-binding domain-containing protein [Burkholderiaceae bacterium]HNB44825.1 cyclic nucleotide-binding domain-containing protein [Burkholderiaceae bacterium]HNG80698.1 cyclic nucleotide-binding domain-containing protein [Burkholderiaceae bacterium]
MGIEELVQVVQSLNTDDAFHARLDLAQWRTLSAYLTGYEARAGDLLFEKGDADRTTYFLGRGTLQVYVPGAPPSQSRIALLRPGSVVGETGLFSDQPHSASVEAMTAVTVWALHLPRFEELVQRAPAIAIELLRAAGGVMAARMRANMAFNTAVA